MELQAAVVNTRVKRYLTEKVGIKQELGQEEEIIPCGYLKEKFSNRGIARVGLKRRNIDLVSPRICKEARGVGMECMVGIIARQDVREATGGQIL